MGGGSHSSNYGDHTSGHHNNKRNLLNQHHHHKQRQQYTLEDAWTGQWFELFFALTVIYFAIDLIWICCIPKCVRSPGTIIQHHIATLIYIIVPYRVPACQWIMSVCMIVEINTWLLIARHVFNKVEVNPWTVIDLGSLVSIRVKFISILFYVTWIAIRVIWYPYLMVPIYNAWVDHNAVVGTRFNLVGLCFPLHSIFCLLNFKWTFDLINSKLRYLQRKGYYQQQQLNLGVDDPTAANNNDSASKGL